MSCAVLLPASFCFLPRRISVTGGRRAPWHSAPFVSPGLRPPPLPHCAERHAALRQQALLAHQGDSSLVRQGNSGTASQGNSGLSLEDDLCMAHQGNSTLAPQHLTMPRESGWTAQRGKGGARRAEDTSEAVHPGSLGVQNLPGCQGMQNHQHQKQIRHPQKTKQLS